MVRTQIQLTEEQAEALRRLAAETDRSMADLVRTAVDAWLSEQPRLPRVARNHRVLAALGRFRSDRDDVAEQHDAFLDDAFAP